MKGEGDPGIGLIMFCERHPGESDKFGGKTPMEMKTHIEGSPDTPFKATMVCPKCGSECDIQIRNRKKETA